jgi:hypothetical protein
MASFVGFVDDAGTFALDDRKAFRTYVRKFKGNEVVVTVKKRPSRQGDKAMRYYRGVVIPDLAEACGYSDPDDYESIHDAMAWKFLRIADGEFGQPRRRSTSKDDMSKDELSAYIDQVITFAETTIPGCRIRRPDEVDLDEIYAVSA